MAAQKWCVIDSNITHGAAETITAYESKGEAMREAWSSWNYLTDREQEQRDYFGVALCDMVWDEYEEAMVPDPSAGYTDSIDFAGEATVRRVITFQGYNGDQKCFENTYCNEITEIPAVELVPGAETSWEWFYEAEDFSDDVNRVNAVVCYFDRNADPATSAPLAMFEKSFRV